MQISPVDDQLTPSRFLRENGGFGFTPGLLTAYGDVNVFDQSFKSAAAASHNNNNNNNKPHSISLPSQQLPSQQQQHSHGNADPAMQTSSSIYSSAAISTNSNLSTGSGITAADQVARLMSHRGRAATRRNQDSESPPVMTRSSTHSKSGSSGSGRQHHTGSSVSMSSLTSPNPPATTFANNNALSHNNAADGEMAVDNEDEEDVNGEEDEEDKRKKHLERNRVAASKSRQRKRQWMQDLERRSEEAVRENDELRNTIERMRFEAQEMRTQLLMHSNCDCVEIQAFIRENPGLFDANNDFMDGNGPNSGGPNGSGEQHQRDFGGEGNF